jgi:hypothetical protein
MLNGDVLDYIWSFGADHREKWELVMEELRFYWWRRHTMDILLMEAVVEAMTGMLENMPD